MEQAATDRAMRLQPSARLQTFLGRELIADPNLAILEFVKNSYDAGADRVRVVFRLSEQPARLTIVDNGTGMDEEGFRFNWLRPGFSQKSTDYLGDAPPTHAPDAVVSRAQSRAPAGEKGLGRLSAGRLGKVMTVWTRPSVESRWLKVVFDWTRFENMYRGIDEIDIPFEYVEEAPDSFDIGTVIRVDGLSQSWSGKVPGRPARGRPRTRLARLKQDLSFLIRAQGNASEDFELSLESDVISGAGDVGPVTAASSREETAEYTYRFEIAGEPFADDEDLIRVTIRREVQRKHPAASPQDLPRASERVVSRNDWPGPLNGSFYYAPPPAGKRATEMDLAPSGVLVYRDDVLVEPYGLPGNDWLGVEARKASRQGHAAIQPSTFSGEVQISRTTNPGLVDMSNRLGLIENSFSDAFVELVTDEFAVFERLVYQEVLENERWFGKKEAKAAQEAGRIEAAAQQRLKSLAHRAGQPLAALNFQLVSLGHLSRNQRVPEDLRDLLRAQAEMIGANVDRLGTIVRKLTSAPALEATETDLAGVAREVSDDLRGMASQLGVAIDLGEVDGHLALVSRDLAVDVVYELVLNAIEAPRSAGVHGTVLIEITSASPSYVDLVVRDDATGFTESAELSEGFGDLPSTKGRPPGGLLTAQNSAVLMRGALEVLSTSEEGTTMVLRLPTGSGPVPGFER